MKIELQSKIGYYAPSVSENRPKSTEGSQLQKSAGSFDGITIKGGQAPSQEEQFAASLSSRLSMEIRKPVSPARVQDLQQQIEQGRYQVDVYAIADSIMLY